MYLCHVLIAFLVATLYIIVYLCLILIAFLLLPPYTLLCIFALFLLPSLYVIVNLCLVLIAFLVATVYIVYLCLVLIASLVATQRLNGEARLWSNVLYMGSNSLNLKGDPPLFFPPFHLSPCTLSTFLKARNIRCAG